MSNNQRAIGSDCQVVKMPVAANIKIEVGDFIFKNAAQNAIPASGLSVAYPSVNLAITAARRSFIGVSFDAHGATEGATNINVGTNGFYRFPSSGIQGATGVGAFVTIASGVGALANQKIVWNTDPSGSIATLAENTATTTDGQSLKIHVIGNVQPSLI